VNCMNQRIIEDLNAYCAAGREAAPYDWEAVWDRRHK
jgi:hypothetical protein